jgi:2',3'-cyclic-nucleotide 3'-phosphodiesterase
MNTTAPAVLERSGDSEITVSCETDSHGNCVIYHKSNLRRPGLVIENDNGCVSQSKHYYVTSPPNLSITGRGSWSIWHLLLKTLAGIAVWLVPSEAESARLQKLMFRHPEPGVPHSFPHFHPHITLAAIGVAPHRPPLPAAAAAVSTRDQAPAPDPNLHPDPTVLLTLREAIPLGQRAVHVRFARVLAGDHYFRSIYIAIAPSPELVKLRSALALAQNRGGPKGPGAGAGTGTGTGPDSPPAFPHLSLYYVADEEMHTRERFLQELEREEVVKHSADGLSVNLRCAPDGSDGESDGWLEGCTCTQIWFVDCGGPVEGWKVLDKILLAK